MAKNNVKKKDDETERSYKCRLLNERHRPYMEKFKEYPRLHVTKSKVFYIFIFNYRFFCNNSCFIK